MIPCLVLAAGKSTRMGRPKALLPLGRHTFLTRILQTCRDAGIGEVVVVLGHEANAVRESVTALGFTPVFVYNAQFEAGQFSSLRAGLAAIDRPDVAATLMTLVDVPLVSAATIRAVVDRYRATGAPVVRPVHGALHGHPVLIAQALFQTLRSADPAAGAKPTVRSHASDAGDVLVDDPGAFQDIDTPDDYARVLERIAAGGAPHSG